MLRKFSLLLVLCAGVLFGTSCRDTPVPDRRIDNVVRVMMHEPGVYTFFTQAPDSLALSMETVRAWEVTKMTTDAPSGEKMWVVIKRHQQAGGNKSDFIIDTLEIHLHSAADIGGAGWDHGKSGQGQTVVVE